MWAINFLVFSTCYIRRSFYVSFITKDIRPSIFYKLHDVKHNFRDKVVADLQLK